MSRRLTALTEGINLTRDGELLHLVRDISHFSKERQLCLGFVFREEESNPQAVENVRDLLNEDLSSLLINTG